ncbi:MAG TPA: YdeI/OmpD-associated family protein [Ohtaekwangia sp.]|nr:YdeI/OmpD-associated family protein [Ohtaekwangia sp.]
MKENDIESFCPKNRQQWRKWLQKNHDKKKSVWLIYYKKESNIPTITWSDAVDEALCFGWIDSQRKSIDESKFMQRFSQRKANSIWSKINKQKIDQLIKDGFMTTAGMKCVEVAKENGSWSVLDEVEELIIPEDLNEAFKKKPGSKKYFLSLSKSRRKLLLFRLMNAKQQETRAKRIREIVHGS